MIYVAMVTTILFYAVITRYFPLTVAIVTAIIYFWKVGLAGHFIVMSSINYSTLMLCVFTVIASLLIDTAKTNKVFNSDKVLSTLKEYAT